MAPPLLDTSETMTVSSPRVRTVTTTTVKQSRPEKSEDEKYREAVWKKYKEQVPVLLDANGIAKRNEMAWHVPDAVMDLFLPMIRDPKKDRILLQFFINMVVGIFPVTYLFWHHPSHLFGLAFFVYRFIVYAMRFVLFLHTTTHNPLFHKKYAPLNYFGETIFAFHFGVPPGFYYIQHCLSHHLGNNIFPYDMSSTMVYQRDDPKSLIHYFWVYFTHSFIRLPHTAFVKRRYKAFALCLFWLAAFLGGAKYLLAINPIFTVWMFHIPAIFMGFSLMFGNFAQHCFIDPNDPDCTFKMAYNCINHEDNQSTFNDSYHLNHHLNARTHWLDHPKWFEDNLALLAKNNAIVFKEINMTGVLMLLFKKDHKQLYKHWVQLRPGDDMSFEDFSKWISHLMKPIPVRPDLKPQKWVNS